LFATDIRQPILDQFEKRLQTSGFRAEKVLLADITQKIPESIPMVDVILLDAPCSGSGTWARNPEGKYAFQKTGLEFYTNKQQKLIHQSLKRLKKGGRLLYSTCSVFEAENEAMCDYAQSLGLKLKWKKYFYHPLFQSDVLFAAEFGE
jgi:16S rRNA (cytosine967-C5)-methyltransferase